MQLKVSLPSTIISCIFLAISFSLVTATTDFIDCNDPCNGGDVNHHLVASVRTMQMLNYTYRGRTYSTDESDSFMGETIRVRAGQSLWIKLTNNLTAATTEDNNNKNNNYSYNNNDNNNANDIGIGPKPPTATEYWNMLQNPGEHIKYQRYKKRVPNPSNMKVDIPNMPHNFDTTNLHLHGLDVEVHMFDPVGTHNPDAPHIAIHPGQCYCYKFNIPSHHPSGMYWYHPHVHGATAIQMWSGMIGLLYVEGVLEDELVDLYNVVNTQEFVIWDPAFKSVNMGGNDNGNNNNLNNTSTGTSTSSHNLEVDDFLLGQTTLSKIHPFLVNGQINPNFNTTVGEVLHLRTLCATIENENTFIVYREGEETNTNWEEVAIPFYIIASDGVTFERPRKKKIIVLSGGQREEIFLFFDTPGRYVISQQGIQGMQFFDMRGHPHDQILATITVSKNDVDNDEIDVDTDITDDTDDTATTTKPTSRSRHYHKRKRDHRPTVPISEMKFTPGYQEEERIKAEDIVASETIVFSMGANFDQAPFPQYYVNGKSFNAERIDFHAQPGEAREYILINANHNAHPFHIHVNRFQVQEVGSELSTMTYPVLESVLDFDPLIWRDTFMVPPNGRTRIWVQYKNYTGKTVLHCHFLAHEDTGMMATLFIGKKDWVFRLNDHIQWIVGTIVGLILGIGFVLFYLNWSWSWNVHRDVIHNGKDDRENHAGIYSAVSLNELKSKAMD